MTKTRLVAALFPMYALFSPVAQAEGGMSFGAGADLAYDSNVWRLAEDKLQKPGTDTQSDDKYFQMESATDTVVSIHGRVDWELQAIGGKDARLRIEPGASLYMQNGKKTHVALDAELTHDAWKGGEVFVRAGILPSQFQKNYLVSADLDGSSKRYDQGISTEARVATGVDTRITKSLDGELWVGAGIGAFNAPFENRNRSILEGGGALSVAAGKRVTVGVAARAQSVGTDSGVEPFIEGGVRVLTPIDRSYFGAGFSPGVEVEITDAVAVRAGYAFLQKSYTSTGTDDPYRDRTDTRHSAKSEVRMKLGKAVRLDVGALFAHGITDRPNDADATANQVDYDRLVVFVGVAASF